MEGKELFARRKNLLIRIVSEKIPMGKRWRVSKEFKNWVDDLSEEEFNDFLDKLGPLTRALSTEETSRPQGDFEDAG